MPYPDFSEFKAYAGKNYKTVPVCTEMYSDMYTPVSVLKKLKNISPHCFILESSEDAMRWGRYSFLGFEPSLELSCKNGVLAIKKGQNTEVYKTSTPYDFVRKIVADNKSPEIEGLPPFTGGLVGYFSYDYIKYAEPCLNLTASDDAHFKDMDLMLFDQVIAFDNLRQKIILIVSVSTRGNLYNNYKEGEKRLSRLKEIIQNGSFAEDTPFKLKSAFKPRFSQKEYCGMVEKAKNYIYEGDIFQVVLANRMEAEMEGSLLDVYRMLRTINPSPYMFYFSGTDIQLAGASPETLVKLIKGVLNTYPLAGSRPRGKTEEEDKNLEKELLSDEKELAEHNMLVDLGRNDIGKVAKLGTVALEKYMAIERYSHIMHIGSTVRGELAEDKDFIDTINSILPAGTLSGAPKIRACEIIDELEGCRRGIYGGAVGYISFTGDLDTCISIRMAYAKNGSVYVCSGAGIVADSVPEKEYAECINKAAATIKACEYADGGLENDCFDR
ncbi:MAG: anthranilate synthase component I [Clostridia bacterium]|nr:anthranilate synthase component I [Clostridia bacterium]